MEIRSRRQLNRLDHWTLPPPTVLDEGGIESVLKGSRSAFGVYFMGHCRNERRPSHAEFALRYVGKAVDQPLYDRLFQHVKGSHNPHVRDALAKARTGQGPKVFFRFAIFRSRALAEEVEGLSIAAYLWEIDETTRKATWVGWNRRNEWGQHWNEGGE